MSRARVFVVTKAGGVVLSELMSDEEAQKEVERVTQALNEAGAGGPNFVRIGSQSTVGASEVVSVTIDHEF